MNPNMVEIANLRVRYGRKEVVKNVTLDDLKTPPYKGVVAFDKVHYSLGSHQERTRETFVAQVTFVLRDQVPSAVIPVNPLGLTVTYFRVDQAFK